MHHSIRVEINELPWKFKEFYLKGLGHMYNCLMEAVEDERFDVFRSMTYIWSRASNNSTF